MGTPAMPDLGQHCSRDDCHQLDFLPFTCNACHKVFCLEHRQYKSHNCPNANDQDVTVIVCPVCIKAIRTVPNEDENATWERHVRTDCDPSNYEKATKKPRCPVRGCKEILVFANKVFCNDCKRDVCVKHRFGPDHGCEDFRKLNSSNRTMSHYGNLFMKSFKERAAPAATVSKGKQPASGASSTQSGGIAGAFTGLYSSVESGINKLGFMNSSSGASSRNSSGRQTPFVASQGSKGQMPKIEECPQCRARFSNVGQLIKHVETMHDAPEMLDVCPKCGMKFRDPILLVNHVERDHGGSSS